MFAKTLTALATAIVLGAAFASPAMSASSKDRHMAAPEQAFAQFTRTGGRWHSSNPAYDVYANGMYVGSDPDRHIRTDLARNPRGATD